MDILIKNNNVLDLLKNIEVSKKPEPTLFVELGRDMFKGNSFILRRYFTNEQGQECYYANLLAFKGVKDLMSLTDLKKILKRDFGKDISLKGYKYDPEHYRFGTQAMQDEYEEDLFKDKSNEQEDAENEAYRRKAIEPIDFNAVESLYTVFIIALQKRYLMMLNMEAIPALLNNALECYALGVSCGPSNDAMNSKIAEIKATLTDKDVEAWLKTGVSDMSCLVTDVLREYDAPVMIPTKEHFEIKNDKGEVETFYKHKEHIVKLLYKNDLTKDYIETYQRAIRSLTEIRDTDFSYVLELIHNGEDVLEDAIMSNNYVDTVSYNDNFIGYDIDKEEIVMVDAYDDCDDYLEDN